MISSARWLTIVPMKLLLLLVFSGFAYAQGGPEPLGGCSAGEVFVEDGGQYCEWIFLNPGFIFICSPTGECQSACYPYECADGVNRQPSDQLRRKPVRKVVPASMVTPEMAKRFAALATKGS